MQRSNEPGSTQSRVAIWIIWVVAVVMCLVVGWAATLSLLKALEFSWDLVIAPTYALAVILITIWLVRSTLLRKRSAIWPATLLFLTFLPLVISPLHKSLTAPAVPPGGFAVSPQEGGLWRRPTEEEFWANEYKRRGALLSWLVFISIPVASVSYLRKNGALT